ncbi:MAG TPA: hybrid sensor histidine kinase/response regulator [Polyangiaceae bacterium]|jgi:CheY-like chemotaxis protein/nitrogen-specific signal transduction histidine kinase|nr:hybrid sensor histidine kinase/response regulator [Polyangiaceae bacterium]
MNPRDKKGRNQPFVVAPPPEESLAQKLAAEREARRDAERESQSKDEFFAALGHELRTPLNAIIGWAHILQNSELSEPDRVRAVEVILRNAKLQASVIDDMLDLSHIMTGKLRLVPVVTYAAHALEMVMDSARPAADGKGITLRSDIPGAPGFLTGDPDRIQQILWNLVANAIKFTPPGGNVRLSCFRDGDFVVWEVTDSGRGIAPEFLPHIFERFRQAEGTSLRSGSGLGLGLSIARQLAELHGGRVTAASEGAGRGATFTLRLPASEALVEDAVVPSAVTATGGEAEMGLSGATVLVIDDDGDTRELLAVLLTEAGARPIAVSSAEEARDLLRSLHVDVLVCDVEMPHEDGYSFMRALRASGEDAGGWVPAIALTGHAGEAHAKESLLAGFQMYAPKPVDPPRLLREIARLRRRGTISARHE